MLVQLTASASFAVGFNVKDQENKEDIWPWIVAAAVACYLGGKWSEGQASITYGQTSTQRNCRGTGSCAGALIRTDNGKPLWHEAKEIAPDYIFDDLSMLKRAETNDIILCSSKAYELSEGLKKFFYSDEVVFSSSYEITDEQTLKELKVNNPIKFKAGKYKVHEEGGYKYIILCKL